MPTYEYIGIRYKHRDQSELLTFPAPVGEIKVWAGVPRKHFNYQHGFQRSLAEKRVNDLKDFYDLDKQNLTPTSVVVAIRQGAARIIEIPEGDTLGVPGLCKISFVLDDFENTEIASLLDQTINVLRNRLGQEVTRQVEQDMETAVEATAEAEASDEAEDSSPEEETDLSSQPTSHMIHFFTELIAMRQGRTPIEDDAKLRQVLFSILKPAIIVDGQHRVYGAAAHDEMMNFAVSAIPDADWLEQVFQFVVINQKAKPIDPAFLHAIIATSLTDIEIEALYDRLRKSGIDVDKAQYMNRINADQDSPFRNMINFEVEGAPGFLMFPGMSTLARLFRAIPKTHRGLLPSEAQWLQEDVWLKHFYAFWRGIRDYFSERDSRLWQEPTESNPNNLLKIVTLQEMQRIVLDSWADARVLKLTDPFTTYEAARNYWDNFPPTFFSDEWKKKGLQTAVGRKYLAEAIQTTRRNLDRRGWGHRRLGLFQDN